MRPMATPVKNDSVTTPSGPSVARPTGREEILDAVLDAAQELMAEHGPQVSLRTIAAHAGVSYSLVHRHFGTKEALVDRLLRRYSEAWLARLDGDVTYSRALELLFGDVERGAGTYLRLLAWSLLDTTDDTSAHLRHVRLTPLIALHDGDGGSAHDAPAGAGPAGEGPALEATRGGDAAAAPDARPPEDSARIDVAASLAMVFGWRLFRPFLVDALELGNLDARELHRQIAHRIQGVGAPGPSPVGEPDPSTLRRS